MNTIVQTTPEQPGLPRADRAAEVSALPEQTRIVPPFANPGIAPCNIGSTTPAATNRQFPWVRQSTTASERDILGYANGQWRGVVDNRPQAGLGSQIGSYDFTVAQSGNMLLRCSTPIPDPTGVTVRLVGVQADFTFRDPDLTAGQADPMSDLWLGTIATFSPAYATVPFAHASLRAALVSSDEDYNYEPVLLSTLLWNITQLYGSSTIRLKHLLNYDSNGWALGTSPAIDELCPSARVNALATATTLSAEVRLGEVKWTSMVYDVHFPAGPDYVEADEVALLTNVEGELPYHFNISSSLQWMSQGSY